MTDTPKNGRSQAQQIIDDCLETYKVCQEALAYSLDQGGDLASHSRIKVLEDCADINLLLAQFMTRASRHFPEVARLCAQISDAAADAVADAGNEHPPLKRVYVVSVRSAKCCRDVLDGRANTEQERERDEALRETFPASDPPAPPTEL